MQLIVCTTHISLNNEAALLAEDLNIPFVKNLHNISNDNLILLLSLEGLGITDNIKNLPIMVNFSSNKANYRRESNQKELIIKAIGINKISSPLIVDATAGLGTDSFVMASFGHQIHMIERSRVVWMMLKDGIKRGMLDSRINHIIPNLTLQSGDSVEILKNLKPQIIYLDPMFPLNNKNIAVKREMSLFRKLIGNDLDVNELLNIAIKYTSYRVVVKRPNKAPLINQIKPTFQIIGRSSRFDVYQVAKLSA